MSDPACLTCGACCAVPPNRPRLWWLDDVAATQRRTDGVPVTMEAERCEALVGVVGDVVGCHVYAVRPAICRRFAVGGADCLQARQLFGLPPLMLPFAHGADPLPDRLEG